MNHKPEVVEIELEEGKRLRSNNILNDFWDGKLGNEYWPSDMEI